MEAERRGEPSIRRVGVDGISRFITARGEIGLGTRPLAGLAAPALKSLFHKLLLIACALHLSGAHWAVLQVTA